jgi:hypothetical protein
MKALQDRKVGKRLSELEEWARADEERDRDSKSRVQEVVGVCQSVLSDIQGFGRWMTFQKGMIARALASSQLGPHGAGDS